MITITVNSVDRSADIELNSISFEQGVTKTPSTFSFSIKKNPSKTIPALGQTVIMSEDSVAKFKGTIVEKNDEIIGNLIVGTEVICKDGLYSFDQRLVAKAYSATMVGAIVADIIATFTTGFTLDIPATTPSVDTARFNYERPSHCLQSLAEQIGWDWYIGPDDVVHFFASENEQAPFEITDDNGKCIFNTLDFNANILGLQNSVYLRGGEYLDAVTEANALDKYEADGEQIVINLGYKYNSIQVTLDGVAQTVGVDFLHDPADYDCLYNFQEKIIRFREDNKPTAGQVVKVFGNVYIPIIILAEDTDSITAYGRREGIKIDKTINSVDEAEQATAAILREWGQESYEGGFKTRETGLRAGQQITINSTIFGINDTFKINRIRGRMNGHNSLIYEVQFIKSGNVTFTDIMVELLGKERKNLTISDDETIQRLTSFSDTLGIMDELIAWTTTSGPYKYGPVTGGNTVGKWGFSVWG